MVKTTLLKQRKKELNLSYDDIAERSGCARRGIISIFQGETPYPRIDTLQKIAEVLELPIDELTTDNDYKVTEPLVQTLTPFKQSTNDFTDDEKELIEAYRKVLPSLKGYAKETVMRLAGMKMDEQSERKNG